MKKGVLVYSVIAITVLLVLEQLLGLTYLPKQLLRIVLFLGGPLFGIYILRKSNLKEEINFEKPTFSNLKIPLISSAVIFFGTVFGYLALQFMFEAKPVIDGLEKIGIGIHNVYIWGLYLSFVNSLLEEFFFRGYVFYSLKKHSYKLAIIISSLLFSLYHSVLMVLLFPIYTVIFTLVGLFIIGAFLAYVNSYGKSFFNSWIVHIFANLGCIIVLIHMYSIS